MGEVALEARLLGNLYLVYMRPQPRREVPSGRLTAAPKNGVSAVGCESGPGACGVVRAWDLSLFFLKLA